MRKKGTPVRMRRSAIALAAAAVLASGCSEGEVAEADLITTPIVSLNDGAQTSLQEELDGRWVLVNFWASFCKPCIREMPEIQKVADQDPLLQVIGINAIDRPELAWEMIYETGVTYEMFADERGDLMAAGSVRSLPATLVLDPDGRVVGQHIGEMDAAGIWELLRSSGYSG